MSMIENINGKIAALAKAEKITKALLGELSREILEYVYFLPMNDDTVGSGDVTPVNRLLAKLTPMNRKATILYFRNFLSWKFDDETGTFTTKKKKQYAQSKAKVADFLEDEANNIWTWADDNIKVEEKNIDYIAKLRKDMTKALDNGITLQQVVELLDEVAKDFEAEPAEAKAA